MQHGPETLDKLKHDLTDAQQEILDAIWEYYCKNREWIPARLLHHRFGKSEVLAELQRVGGSIVIRTDEPRQSRYMLTFLGVLLTKDGEQVEGILVQYLSYVRQRFLDDPLIEAVGRKEVAEALGLSEDYSGFLFHLIDIAHFWGGSASHSQDDWRVGVPNDIDELPEVRDLRAYVRSRALRYYDPNLPLGAPEKTGYLWRKAQEEKEHSEFWFILDIALRQQIEADWIEAQSCRDVKAWKACTVMCASVLEGLLLDTLRRKEPEAQEVCRRLGLRGQSKKPAEWGLSDMVRVAGEIGIIRQESTHLLEALRGYRNLIHPGRQLRDHTEVTENKARIAMAMVGALREELSQAGEEA